MSVASRLRGAIQTPIRDRIVEEAGPFIGSRIPGITDNRGILETGVFIGSSRHYEGQRVDLPPPLRARRRPFYIPRRP